MAGMEHVTWGMFNTPLVS